MVAFGPGVGYCKDGYMGDDGKGGASVKACNDHCLQDGKCNFAAYYTTGKRCARYSASYCDVVTTADDAMGISLAATLAHKLHVKTHDTEIEGLFLFFEPTHLVHRCTLSIIFNLKYFKTCHFSLYMIY